MDQNGYYLLIPETTADKAKHFPTNDEAVKTAMKLAMEQGKSVMVLATTNRIVPREAMVIDSLESKLPDDIAEAENWGRCPGCSDQDMEDQDMEDQAILDSMTLGEFLDFASNQGWEINFKKRK